MPIPPGYGPLGKASASWIDDVIVARIRKWFNDRVDAMMLSFDDLNRRITGNADKDGVLSNSVITRLVGTKTIDPIVNFIFSIMGIGTAAWSLVTAAAKPYAITIQREVQRLNPLTRPSLHEMLDIKNRVPDLAPTMDRYIAEEGLDPVSLQGLEALSHPLLGVRDYFEGWARGDLTDDELRVKLKQLDYLPDEIHTLEVSFPNLLNLSQAIEQSQHNTIDNGTASRYGLDDGITSDYLAVMKKLHYDEDTARQIWRMSRQVPGVSQAFEMVHRLRPGRSDMVFEDQDLDYVLSANGYSNYWRDRLKRVSDPTLPRLIISGMYRAGQMTADEVLDAVKDLGYTGDRADKVAAYITRDAKSDKQTLSRDAIIQAYKRGIYSNQETHSALINIGLSEDEASFYLSLADYDLEAQMTDVKLQVIQAKYVNGTIDETGLAVELGPLNLPSERTNALQQLWTIQRNNKTNIPGRSELDDFLRRAIIDHATYQDLLKRDGYEPTTIGYFVARIDQIIADDAQAELSAQQTEQQRLSTATLRTTYQTGKADIAVQIAQLKTAIADITLALHSVTDPAIAADLTAQAAQYKNDIVHLQEQAANLYKSFLQAQTTPGA